MFIKYLITSVGTAMFFFLLVPIIEWEKSIYLFCVLWVVYAVTCWIRQTLEEDEIKGFLEEDDWGM